MDGCEVSSFFLVPYSSFEKVIRNQFLIPYSMFPIQSRIRNKELVPFSLFLIRKHIPFSNFIIMYAPTPTPKLVPPTSYMWRHQRKGNISRNKQCHPRSAVFTKPQSKQTQTFWRLHTHFTSVFSRLRKKRRSKCELGTRNSRPDYKINLQVCKHTVVKVWIQLI